MPITGTGTGPFKITGTETTIAIYNYIASQNAANATKNSDNSSFDFNVVLNVGDGTTTTVWNSSEESVRIDANSFRIEPNATLNIGLSNPARGGSYWRWEMAGDDQFIINGNLNAYASRLYASRRVASNTGAVIYFEECVIAFLDSLTNFNGPQNPTINYVRCFVAGATAVAVKLGGTVSLTGTKISGAGYAFQPLKKSGSPAIYTVNDYIGQSNTSDVVPNTANSGELNIIGAFNGSGTPRASLITTMHVSGNTVRLQWKYNLTSLYNNAGQTGTNVRIRNLQNMVVYTGQTNGGGAIPQQILTRMEYINNSTAQNRFPYEVKLRKYDRTSVDLVYQADNHTTQQAVHTLVPYLTLTEAQALALTGITLTPSGATSGIITPTSARTASEAWQFYRAWIAQTINFGSDDTWTYDGMTLNTGAWTLIGAEFLTGAITTPVAKSNGAISNLTINGNVIQSTPANLTGVVITGTLTYDTNSDITITITNTTIDTVINNGTGIVTINKVNSTIVNYTDAEINFIDSTIAVIGADTVTFHPTANERDLNQNSSGSFTSSYAFKFGSTINGSLMSGTLYLRCVAGGIPFNIDKEIILGDNLVNLGPTAQLASLSAKIDLTAKEASLNIVNQGVQKASKFKPHSTNL